jgi:hypothetical protein
MKDKNTTTDDLIYRFLDEIVDFTNGISEEDKGWFVSEAIFRLAMEGGNNHYESIGILQCAILDFHQELLDHCKKVKKSEKKKSK